MALHHAAPGEAVDLRPYAGGIRDARTHAIAKTESFEAVRLVVLQGAHIPDHKVDGAITLYCIEGAIELGCNRGPISLRAGQWVYLEPGEVHSVKGVEDSSLLLTILFG